MRQITAMRTLILLIVAACGSDTLPPAHQLGSCDSQAWASRGYLVTQCEAACRTPGTINHSCSIPHDGGNQTCFPPVTDYGGQEGCCVAQTCIGDGGLPEACRIVFEECQP